MDRLRQWAACFDAMSLRERLLILVTLIVAVVLSGFSYLIEPAQIETSTLHAEYQQLQAQRAEARVDYELARAARVADSDIVLQERIDQLRQQRERQTQQLELRSALLVSPAEMVALLQQVLTGHQGVRLIEAHKAAPVKLNEAADGVESATSVDLYRHDLELVVEGNFAQILGFLQAVETANQALFWHSMDYQIGLSQTARLTLQVYTLSTLPDWLGV